MKVLIVATARPDDRVQMPHLPIPPQRMHNIRLQPFDRETVLDFLEAAAGHSLDEIGPPLARLIHERAAGNPFFCREFVLHLVDQGALAQVDGRWTMSADLDTVGAPTSLTRVVDERLERLSDLARDVLRWVALIGTEADPDLLFRLVDASESDVIAALDACVDNRLLRADDQQFRFHHALVRSSLTDALPDAERSQMHRRIADALLERRAEGRDVPIAELARHFATGAGDHELDEAVAFCVEAAEQEMSQLAYEGAVAQYRQAIELHRSKQAIGDDHIGRRSDLLNALVAAAMRAGDRELPAFASAAIDAATDSGDPRRLASALLASSSGAASVPGTVNADRVKLIESTLERLPPEDDPLRARLLAVLSTEVQYTGEQHRVLLLGDEALGMARRLGDRPTRIFVLVERLGAIRLPDHLDAQLADVVELGRLSRLEGARSAEFFASYRAADIHLAVNDLAGHHTAVENALRLAEELGQPGPRIRALRVHQEKSWLAGDLANAGSELDELEALVAEVNQERSFLGSAMGARAKLASALGQWDVAVECYERLTALPRGIDGFTAGLGVSKLQAGDIEGGRKLYEQLLAKGIENMSLDPTRTHVLSFIASMCATLGDTENAASIDAELEPYSHLWVIAGSNSYGPVQHFRARLHAVRGLDERADEAFNDAAARCRKMEAPLLEAWNEVAWAEFCLDRGDLTRGRELADRAADTGARYGATGIELAAFEVVERIDAIAAHG